ncbi:hypothetical protein EIP91_006003 [Steccherinum ochraceum]|uniref:Uncharacterized protein n=1 Tax=Steccherinum ochraceum TaxID=92696 RepID=A0A4R0RES4_9APHY|nr:hypothetical protein EIP91_006003 [Steccherinum ochraceum]
MSALKASVEALVALIASSAQGAVAAYENHECDAPSLEGHLETRLSKNRDALMRNVRILEGACAQLCASLMPPATYMSMKAQGAIDVACLNVVLKAKVADILDSNTEGLDIAELASLTGLHTTKLLKVMRNLASKHIFTEVFPNVFSQNDLSRILKEDNPVSLVVGMRVDEDFRYAMCNLHRSMQDPLYSQSLAPNRSAFSYGIHDEVPNGTFYDYKFNRAMDGMAEINGHHSIVQEYPWCHLPDGTTICDVGCGVGIVTQVLSHTRVAWDQCQSKILTSGRVQFVPLDFFRCSPLRQITHNWSDEQCLKILKNIRSVMNPGSRVLIHDIILLSNKIPIKTEGCFSQAPKPLLPNFGVGSARLFSQDISMMALFNAGERTLDEIKTLGSSAGLTFVKFYDLLDTGLVEFEIETATKRYGRGEDHEDL